MIKTETMNQKHQEDLQRIRNFRLMDDDFLTKCFDGNTACIELVLRIVLDKADLAVMDVRTKEGVAVMCKAMEDMRNESLKEGMRKSKQEIAIRMLSAGKYTLDEIAAISGLTMEEIKRLEAGQTA